LGHQSRFVLGWCTLGVGLGIAGLSLSLTLSVMLLVFPFLLSKAVWTAALGQQAGVLGDHRGY
jgi:hypothetical protein